MEIVYKIAVAGVIVLWGVWTVWLAYRYQQLLPLEKATQGQENEGDNCDKGRRPRYTAALRFFTSLMPHQKGHHRNNDEEQVEAG